MEGHTLFHGVLGTIVKLSLMIGEQKAGCYKNLFWLSPQVTTAVCNKIIDSLPDWADRKHLWWALLLMNKYGVEPANEAITGVSREKLRT